LAIGRAKETPSLSGSVFRSPGFKTFQRLLCYQATSSDQSSKLCLYLRVVKKAQQSGKNVLNFLLRVSSLMAFVFSEVRQLLRSLCFQLISTVQNGCDDGHRCWFDYWLHFWLVEHYSVRIMKTREIWPLQTFFNRGGAGPRGALATLSQYMLSSAATFGFFLAIGSVSDALMQRILSTNLVFRSSVVTLPYFLLILKLLEFN